MKTKVCTKCSKRKLISEFNNDKSHSDGKDSECKQCCKKTRKKFKKEHPENVILRDIKTRCNNPNSTRYFRYGGRGIKCLITKEEIKQLMIRDNYWDLKKPSIDRIDNDGNYCYENCRFIELEENLIKGNKETLCKKVKQFDLQGNFIKEWSSIKQAGTELNIPNSNISACAKQKRYHKTAGGFIWIF